MIPFVGITKERLERMYQHARATYHTTRELVLSEIAQGIIGASDRLRLLESEWTKADDMYREYHATLAKTEGKVP